MKKLLFVLPVFAFLLAFSCSKSNSSPSQSSADYTGTYVGNEGSLAVMMQVFKGSTDNQIKILYGAWSTPASLNGNHFTITPTTIGEVAL
jgi:hypothetical protein